MPLLQLSSKEGNSQSLTSAAPAAVLVDIAGRSTTDVRRNSAVESLFAAESVEEGDLDEDHVCLQDKAPNEHLEHPTAQRSQRALSATVSDYVLQAFCQSDVGEQEAGRHCDADRSQPPRTSAPTSSRAVPQLSRLLVVRPDEKDSLPALSMLGRHFRSWSLAGWLTLAACLGLLAFLSSGHRQTASPKLTPASHFSPVLKTKAIEEIALGDRVLGESPVLTAAERRVEEPNPKSWRTVELRITKSDGSPLAIRLLRPLDWIEDNGARAGEQIHLVLPEFHLEGTATVVSIGPCPTIRPGPGHVVTGTFRHTVSGALDLHVEGLDEPLGVTANHPFWSLTRQTFVPAGKLEIGEEIRRHDGVSSRVATVEQRQGPQLVYNMEVQGEHVYEVSRLGLLVHNASEENCGKKAEDDGPTTRIRHYTNRKGIRGIEQDQVIRASDQNKVFAEPASRKPLSPRDAEKKYGIKNGHGRDYVETDVPSSRVKRVWNEKTKNYELQIEGDIPLQNPDFKRRN